MTESVSSGLITRSPDMSIRTCVWPDCSSRFPTAQGPSTEGWKVFACATVRMLLCPFHSGLDHAPQMTAITRLSMPARFSCLCGSWSGDLVDSLVRGVREWQSHIAVTLGEG